MTGPSGHGQRNKAHKAGRRAGASARQKHAAAKACHPCRTSIKSGAAHPAGGKAARLQAARAMREAAKASAAAGRRAARAAPRVVGVLGLSADADAAGLWTALAAACLAVPGGAGADASSMAAEPALPHPTSSGPLTLPLPAGAAPGGAATLLLLPLLADPTDPLALVDLFRAADVLVLAVPGDDRAHPVALDADGEAALALLRALGPPPLVAAATLASSSPSARPPDLKARSAAKKRAAAVVADQVPGVEARAAVWWAGEAAGGARADGAALARAAAEARGSLPRWRAGRAGLLVEAAAHDPATGTLTLTGTVRGSGLSAAGLVHVPGAGDFQVEAIRVVAPGVLAGGPAAVKGGMELDATPAGAVISVPPSDREPLTRENEPAEEDGVWPAPGDMAAADAALAVAAEAEAAAAAAASARLRRLPAGTSDYQAAWLDADGLRGGGEDEDDDDDEEEVEGAPPAAGGGEADAPPWEPAPDDGATDAMDFDDDDDGEEGDEAAELAARKAAARAACAAAADDAAWPDEVDTPPPGVAARVRFGKFRGLASWRSSAWDPADGAPPEYARVFAFENARRAAKRAAAAAADPSLGAPGGGAPGAAPGARVQVTLAAVPAAAGVAVATRVAAFAAGAGVSPGAPPPPPLVAWGLLQHEGRLSVVHWAVRSSPAHAGPPLPGKSPVLFVTGVRTFTARPIWSTDDHGATKFKLERFLHPGRHAVASAYAPIAHAPGPLLGFVPDTAAPGRWALALSGGLRGADPDRVILKKAVLTGYPAKVHKRKAVVRWMFTGPEDVRWFAPVELWTKGGRRGRVKEPVGTHGAFKAVFDGQVAQQDAVCLSLYKRAVPPWPADVGSLWVG